MYIYIYICIHTVTYYWPCHRLGIHGLLAIFSNQILTRYIHIYIYIQFRRVFQLGVYFCGDFCDLVCIFLGKIALINDFSLRFPCLLCDSIYCCYWLSLKKKKISNMAQSPQLKASMCKSGTIEAVTGVFVQHNATHCNTLQLTAVHCTPRCESGVVQAISGVLVRVCSTYI